MFAGLIDWVVGWWGNRFNRLCPTPPRLPCALQGFALIVVCVCVCRLGALKCGSNSTNLVQCMTKPWGSTCSHAYDVAVKCWKK